jgi:two-component system, sensor histidine kinase RegB
MEELLANNPLRVRGKVHHLNLAWVIRLRWVAIIGQTVVIFAARDAFAIDFPYPFLFTILVLETLSNIGLAMWARRINQARESLVGSVLVIDILFLTSLLYWTGGAFNPFALLYFIHIVMAALLLRSSWTWAVTLQCVLIYGALYFVYSPQDLSWVTVTRLNDIEVNGRMAAFAVTAGVLAFFINRIQQALSRRDAEIVRIRDAQMRSERLASLATLAAGAAHEFSTPLATIAVVAGELERGLEARGSDPSFVEDTRLIRAEVERCRYILQQMSAHAGESPGELSTTITVADLISETLDGLPRAQRVDIRRNLSDVVPIQVPLSALGQALRGLLNNALDASDTTQNAIFTIDALDDRLVIQVQDEGEGMSPEILARVGEPFFTTKSPGKGMGLGVFLARSLVDKLNGRFHLESSRAAGTLVIIEIPGAVAERPPAAHPSVPEVAHD